MARHKTTELSPKHWKALELIEEGTVSLKDIAHSVGWNEYTLYDLMSGNVAKTGGVGELFYAELRKIHTRNVAKVKQVHKENQKLALYTLNERLRDLKSKGTSKEVAGEVCKIMNSMGKAGPNIEITNNTLAFNGYSPEDLMNEFRRLGSIARSTLNGKGVPGSESGGPGSLPELTSE